MTAYTQTRLVLPFWKNHTWSSIINKAIKKNKIIYVAPSIRHFMKNDVLMLSKRFRVVTNSYAWEKKSLTPVFMLRQLFFMLWHIWGAKGILISFGGYWALVPSLIGKMFRVKVAIILNGTDCASLPPLSYGALRKPLLRTICGWSYQLADVLLPVSSSLIHTKNTYFSDDEYSYQGVKHFFPNLTTPHEVVANGLDIDFWQPLAQVERQPSSFITVFSQSQFVLKGGDLIVQLAERLPGCQFYIGGAVQPHDLPHVPDNLVFLGRLSPEELREYYSRCRFYFQLSIFEGFGVALCEAMLCGCVAIGSSVNAIPEIIGQTGFIVKERDTDGLEKQVREILSMKGLYALGQKARERIVENYARQKREAAFIRIFEN